LYVFFFGLFASFAVEQHHLPLTYLSACMLIIFLFLFKSAKRRKR